MAAWAVIENQSKVLFIKRSVHTSRAGQWCFPGGGIKKGESAMDACMREAYEEVGLSINVLRFIESIDDQYFYLCKMTKPEQQINLKLNECCEYAWVEPRKLLELGQIMDLKMISIVFASLGVCIPTVDAAKSPSEHALLPYKK